MKRGLFLLSTLLAAAPLGAATIRINNTNAAGEGFNDPAPRTPVGGNTGTTLGAQRMKAFEEAARIWGEILPSDVTITIDASFDALECDATSAVLGSAGTNTVHSDFPGAIVPNIWYHQALANKLAGTDLDADNDLRARFNRNLGTPDCLASSGFYLGLDNNHGNLIDLVTILLHEFGHGLGFSTFVRGSTGALFQGMTDVYSRYLYDNSRRLGWDFLTESQRRASAIGDGRLVWAGTSANTFARSFLRGKPQLVVESPSAVKGTYTVVPAAFGPAISRPGVSGTAVLAVDGSGAANDGCEAITNASQVAGNIAIVDRGTCNFTVKVKNAQNAGATAVVIVNNVAPGIGGLSGDDATITIPSGLIEQSPGGSLKSNLPASVTLGANETQLSGSDVAGKLLMYSPGEFSSGSSVSHWDISASPNLLMEPFASADSPHSVDATLDMFRDIGWFGKDQASPAPLPTWLLPSSARVRGANGAFFTTDLTITNGDSNPADVTVQFLSNNRDGREGPVKTLTLAPGSTVTHNDVLSSLFGIEADFGAVLINASSARVAALGQTSTPPPNGQGTFGQSVAAAGPTDVIVNGAPRAIPAVTDDARFRSNLIIASATEGPIDVDILELAEDGSTLGTLKVEGLRPFEMRQLSGIHKLVAGSGNVTNATLVLSTPTPGGAFAAYVASIDNRTNDPRTLTPGAGASGQHVLPSSARAAGANNAFFTTDLTIANRGTAEATVVLKFLGNSKDGTEGPEISYAIGAGQSRTFTDVLRSVFAIENDFGAILITSTQPVVIFGQTSTPPPDGQGTFGQSVPAAAEPDLITFGLGKVIPGVRQDSRFRTNLIFVNTTRSALDIEVTLRAADGSAMGTKTYAGLKPYEMRQISGVVNELAPGNTGVSGASLLLTTPNASGSFAAYAAEIDNVTNDPRTLLPK